MIDTLSYSAAPRTLKAVANLFIIFGIFSVIDTVAEFFLGRIVFNLGILYILVGRGLLRFQSRWLTWAMFCTWIWLISMPIAAAVSLFTPSRLQHLEIFGLDAGRAPYGLCFILSAAAFTVCCWQYHVLKSRQVRQLF